jgi:hypothetical protein
MRMTETLRIKLPNTYHNNYGLEVFGPPDLIERFDGICHREFWPALLFDDDGVVNNLSSYNMKKSWGAFWQGQDKDWLYIEFWMEQSIANQDRLIDMALRIGEELGLPIDICE